MALMLEKLEVDKNKIPSPTREEMVKLLHTAWKETTVDFPAIFKSLFVTSALDGSDDYLVSDRLFDLIGEDMRRFRTEMLRLKVPENLQSVIKNLIPPKGICRKNIEGTELLDLAADEDVVEVQEQQQDDESASDSGEENSAEPELAAAIPLQVSHCSKMCDDSAMYHVFI